MFRKAFADSVWTALKNAGHDTTRVNCYYHLAGAYLPIKERIDSGLILGKKALALAEKIKWEAGLVKGLLVVGTYYHNTGDFKEHIRYTEKALDVCYRNFSQIYSGTDLSDDWMLLLLNTLHSINWSHMQDGTTGESIRVYEQILNEWKGKAPPGAMAELKMHYGIHLNSEYQSGYKEAIIFLKEALAYWEKTGDVAKGAETHYALARSYQQRNIYVAALKHMQEGLKYSLSRSDTGKVMDAYHQLGTLYNKMSDYRKGLEYYNKELALRESVGNIDRLAGIYMSIGITYFHLGKLDSSLLAHSKSLEYCDKTNNWTFRTMEMNNVAIVLLKQGRYQDAIDSLATSVVARRKHFDQIGAAWYVTAIGDVYLQWSKPDKALKAYLSVIDTIKRFDDKDQLIRNCTGTASAYQQLGDYKNALQAATEALTAAEKIQRTDRLAELHFLISSILEASGNTRDALEQYKLYSTLRDSLLNTERSREMGKAEAGLEFEIQQALKDAEYKKNLELSAEREKRQEIISWMIGASTLLVIGFLFFVFNRLKVTRRQKNIIEQQHEEVNRQKDEIEEKNKEITASIQYAKRIQSSLLPSERYLERKIRDLRK